MANESERPRAGSRAAAINGHDLSRQDAEIATERMVKAPDEQVHADIDRLLQSPSTLAERAPLPKAEALREPEAPMAQDTAKMLSPEMMQRDMLKPEQHEALINDLDKLRMTKDKQIPVGVDEHGEPVYRSLDSMVEEIKQNKDAAKALEGCITPQKTAA